MELRRQVERVAAQRQALPPGGEIPEDYVFEAAGASGKPKRVRLPELFAPGKDTLAISTVSCSDRRGSGRVRAACISSMVSTVPRGIVSRDVLLVAIAVAEGAKAAVAINKAFLIRLDGFCEYDLPQLPLSARAKWA